MDVIGHQDKGMDQAACAFGIVHQPVEIKQIVLIGKKTGLPVVAALDDMKRYTRGNDSGSSRHSEYAVPRNGRLRQKRGLSPIFLAVSGRPSGVEPVSMLPSGS